VREAIAVFVSTFHHNFSQWTWAFGAVSSLIPLISHYERVLATTQSLQTLSSMQTTFVPPNPRAFHMKDERGATSSVLDLIESVKCAPPHFSSWIYFHISPKMTFVASWGALLNCTLPPCRCLMRARVDSALRHSLNNTSFYHTLVSQSCSGHGPSKETVLGQAR